MKTFLNFRNNLTMLYKNLDDRDLQHVMFIRWFLDYLAAFEMLILKETWATSKLYSRREGLSKSRRKDFDEDRQRIQSGRVEGVVPQVYEGSILWQYYAKEKSLLEIELLTFLWLELSKIDKQTTK